MSTAFAAMSQDYGKMTARYNRFVAEILAELAWVDRTDLLSREDAFVYRVRDAAGVVIYVGMTFTTLEERFSAHRSQLTPASWWKLAASIESARVSPSEAQQVEREEIHRYHPSHNRQCAICGQAKAPIRKGRPAPEPPHPLRRTWRDLVREHPELLHPAWHDKQTFLADIDRLLGPRPPKMRFGRICIGMYEPGNVCWLRGGRTPVRPPRG